MITLKQIAAMLAFACAVTFAACVRSSPHREYSLTLWNWDPSCAHLSDFKRWAKDFKAIGGTEIYISAAWKRLEPMPGHYRFGFIARRLAVARKIGLRLGVRINSYWGGATPSWLHVDKMEYESGKVTSLNIPSINDPRFWRAFSPLCTHLAEHFRGQHVDWCAFIGSQAENKYGSWCTFDPASLELWRKTVRANPRPRWLARIVGDAPLPQIPPVPGTTHGTPDRTAADMAFIAFRQENWRTALKRFNRAIRAGDPKADIVVQLGESYRSGSAEMSNLDYYGMSRGADKILQSYDFDLNAHQGIWKMQADLATFQGITLKPVVIEFDDPVGMAALGYTPAFLTAMGRAAVEQGCGIEECNAGGYKTLPSGYSYMKKWGQICETAGSTRAMRRDPRHTILLYVSKWANYCYREPTRWLNLAQFGAWRMLKTNGYRVRIICGDDLRENLNDYRGLYVAFSPEQLIPMATRRRLLKLESVLPTIVEVKNIPRKLGNRAIIVEHFAGRTQSVLAAGRRPAVDIPSTRWRFYSQDAAGYLHSPMRISHGPEAGTHSCRTNFKDAAYIRLRKLGHDHLPGIITVRAQVQVNTAERVGVGFYSKPPRDATDGFSGFFINRDNGQLQLCVDGNLVGPPRPAPFLGWQPGKFYTVSLTVDTHTGEVASLSYNGHDIMQEFSQPIRGFGKSSTAYAGFVGWSGSSASATGYVANFEVLGHGATFSGHAPGIGTFARYVPGLPIAPELSHPVRRSPSKVILGYPLAYIWNSGLDHAAQQRVLLWAIRNTWERK
jgi:hypothetical protein